MALAMSFISIVLPVLGWATMRARCPFPIGVKRSTNRQDVLSPLPEHRLNFSSGKRGTRCSNEMRSRTSSGNNPLMRSMSMRAKNFSPSRGIFTWPSTTSPGLRPNCRICVGETYRVMLSSCSRKNVGNRSLRVQSRARLGQKVSGQRAQVVAR